MRRDAQVSERAVGGIRDIKDEIHLAPPVELLQEAFVRHGVRALAGNGVEGVPAREAVFLHEVCHDDSDQAGLALGAVHENSTLIFGRERAIDEGVAVREMREEIQVGLVGDGHLGVSVIGEVGGGQGARHSGQDVSDVVGRQV